MLRDNYNGWDGTERRSIDRRNITRDEVGYYVNDYPPQHHEQPQVIIEQPKQQWKITPAILIAALYPIIGGIGSYTWQANERITKIEYNIQTITDRHNNHEKEDIEFKQELKELSTKIDRLKEQLSSMDNTVMQVLSDASRNQRRSP